MYDIYIQHTCIHGYILYIYIYTHTACINICIYIYMLFVISPPLFPYWAETNICLHMFAPMFLLMFLVGGGVVVVVRQLCYSSIIMSTVLLRGMCMLSMLPSCNIAATCNPSSYSIRPNSNSVMIQYNFS